MIINNVFLQLVHLHALVKLVEQVMDVGEFVKLEVDVSHVFPNALEKLAEQVIIVVEVVKLEVDVQYVSNQTQKKDVLKNVHLLVLVKLAEQVMVVVEVVKLEVDVLLLAILPALE